MTLEVDEPEILDGSRAWAKTQQLFEGRVDPTRKRHAVKCTWYDTTVNEHEGAFCMVQAGSDLEDLVGDLVRVAWRNTEIFVYCIGGSADLPYPLALSRRAMWHVADLAKDHIDVTVQALRS